MGALSPKMHPDQGEFDVGFSKISETNEHENIKKSLNGYLGKSILGFIYKAHPSVLFIFGVIWLNQIYIPVPVV